MQSKNFSFLLHDFEILVKEVNELTLNVILINM